MAYETPKLVILGSATHLTQGTGFGGCFDYGGAQLCDCLVSATNQFCADNPTSKYCKKP